MKQHTNGAVVEEKPFPTLSGHSIEEVYSDMPPTITDVLRAIESQGAKTDATNAKIDRLCDVLEKQGSSNQGKFNVVGWIGIAVVLIGHAIYTGRILERSEMTAIYHKEELKRVDDNYARQVQELKDAHKATENLYTNLRVAVERKGIRLEK